MRLTIISLCCLLMAAPNAAIEPELVAPARVLRARVAQPSANMQPEMEAPPPTITRGLLPQYQSAIAFRTKLVKAPSAQPAPMRFVLALPDQFVVLDAAITIDGLPFEMSREQRIDRLIAELNKPEPANDESTSEENEAEAAKTPDPEAESTPDDQSDDEVSDAAEPEVELISMPSPALESRLRRYVATTGRPASRDEVRWLLAKWVDGPTVLLLDENFQRFRAGQAPAFNVLDRDLDGTIAADEVKMAEETLRACDVNQNDVVEYTEIAEVADDPRRKRHPRSRDALIPLFDTSAAAKALQRLAGASSTPDLLKRFDDDENGELNAVEMTTLREMKADVVVAVAFDRKDTAKSTIHITHFAPDLGEPRQLAPARQPWITIPIGAALVEFSSVQLADAGELDQVSVGLVNDGYPLLPVIDPNEDGRLSIRELRGLNKRLAQFDTDKDGAISHHEVPATIRISFGLGPIVHRHLADIRRVHSRPSRRKVEVPVWFTEMDRNKDGDISPREFLLGDDKFKQVDTDGDGLISAEEGAIAEAEANQ